MKKYYYKSLFTGFYGVCVSGGFTDGFLNKCAEDGVPLWNLKSTSKGRLYFCTPCKMYDAISENAALSGAEAGITGTFGLLPVIKKYKDRACLLVGIVLSVVLISLMSMRIWSINVSGNGKMYASEILEICDELGLRNGVKKSSIDIEAFQRELIEKSQGRLIWVSLNMEGMRAEIEVRETVTVEDDIIGMPCNYIADFDGVIKICRVYSGTAQIKRGSAVHEGDLLISGVIEYETGESSFTEARGKITAQHEACLKTKTAKSTVMRKYGATKTHYSLSLFGFEIGPFIKRSDNTEVTKEERYLEINGVKLPFYVGCYRVTNYEEESVSDGDVLGGIALYTHLSRVCETFKNSRMVSYSEKHRNGYEGYYEVIDYIGKKSVIMLENE